MSDDKKPGRPKLFDGSPVSVRLPADLHDVLSVEAIHRRMDLSELIRKRLRVSYLKMPQGQTSAAQ